MQLSRFATNIKIDEDDYMLYSLKTRQYYPYKKEAQEQLEKLLDELNKGEYTLEEIQCIEKLMKKGILISDNQDELAELEFLENKTKYQTDQLNMMVVVTNACNFRCEYCVQEHEIKNLSSNAEHNILEFIKNNAKIKRNITISWFGGEPLLKFADIKRMLHKACQYGDEYGCKITSDITTNGYLLNEQNIREMKQLNVKSIQITIDGDRESHNKRRYLAGAGETYDKIKENLIKVSEQNIFVILRINIDEKKCRHRNKYIK
jgi:uncharacterized protein